MVLMMITFTEGNLLDADVEALVNTVNTVGIMGKGVALMFKEAFPENFKAYEEACKRKEVRLGHVFAVRRDDLYGPKWIINFPTKGHWRYPSKIEWIEEGLQDLKKFIEKERIGSIALPPLGSGNGGLEWSRVRQRIEAALASMHDVQIIVYEPTSKYQNVAKRAGVEKLTPAVDALKLPNKFNFGFGANKFGPYSGKLTHMLNGLDGSYLHCEKRLSDAGPFDVIHFDEAKKDQVAAYLTSPDAKIYRSALDATSRLIDGLESPFGMELLATVDWLVQHDGVEPETHAVRAALHKWPGDQKARERKVRLFDERVISIALQTLEDSEALAISRSN